MAGSPWDTVIIMNVSCTACPLHVLASTAASRTVASTTLSVQASRSHVTSQEGLGRDLALQVITGGAAAVGGGGGSGRGRRLGAVSGCVARAASDATAAADAGPQIDRRLRPLLLTDRPRGAPGRRAAGANRPTERHRRGLAQKGVCLTSLPSHRHR